MTIPDVPGRQTRPAYTTERRGWYGYGQTTTMDKRPVGRVLHDFSGIFGEISIFALPVLLIVAAGGEPSFYGVTTATFAAWLTLAVVATAIRGGWIRPLATDTLGWVSYSPALVGLRLVYYNTTLLLAGYGGWAVAVAVDTPASSVAIALAVSTLAALSFPRLGERLARWERHRRRSADP